MASSPGWTWYTRAAREQAIRKPPALRIGFEVCTDEDESRFLLNRVVERKAITNMSAIFRDGFESGDTSAWSATAP